MENQPKKKSPVGIILLILLLLILGGVGYLYYSVVKAPLALDNPQALAGEKPMAVEERFSLSQETVQVRMDKGDIWSLIQTHAGENFLDVVNDELSTYGLSVSGCAIRLEEEGVTIDLELYYGEKRLVAQVPCILEVSNGRMILTPAGAKLGMVSLPVEGLLSDLKLEYDLALPVLEEITSVGFAKDAIVLTGTTDIQSLLPGEEKQYQAAMFSDSLQSLTDALLDPAGMDAYFTHLAQNPGEMEDLYRDLFTLAEPQVTETYLADRYGMTQRFFPDIDFSAVAAEEAALTELLNTQIHSLEQLLTRVANEYNDKKFTLSGGQFLKKGKEVRVTDYGQDEFAELFTILDPESFFLILVGAEDAYLRNTSSFYRMADEKQQFTQEVDFNRTYILGIVFRSVDGDPFLMYETEIQGNNTYSRSVKMLPISEEEVQALQVPETFGVWIG